MIKYVAYCVCDGSITNLRSLNVFISDFKYYAAESKNIVFK